MDSQMECCDEQSLTVVDVTGLDVGRYNETFAYLNGAINILAEVDSRLMVSIQTIFIVYLTVIVTPRNYSV